MFCFMLGFLFQSLLTCLALIAFDNQKQVLGLLFAGPVVWVIVGVFSIIQNMTLIFLHHYYQTAMIDPLGGLCYCPSDYADYLCEMDYGFNRGLTKKYKIEDGWRKSDCAFDIVNVRYTPLKIIKAEDMYKVPRTILEKAKKEYLAKED